MARALAVGAVILALTTTDGVAHATPNRHVFWFLRSMQIAHKTFPNVCTPLTVLPPDAPEAAQYNAGPLSDVMALSWPKSCRLWVNPEWVDWPWWMVCSTMVHEFGHLSGLGDNNTRRSVMYWRLHHLRQCPKRP